MSRRSHALRALFATLAGVALAGAAAAQPDTARPRIGLVLGGGGARGAAHVGVLEVLERLRVPVDCVAGTSMGALVSGALASGLSPAQMRKALADADWADMFNDDPDFAERNYRSKRLTQRYLAGSELGIAPDGVRYLPGMLNGEKIKLFFNQLVHDDAAARRIEALPLPLSIIATDIGDGSRVVFREGSLTQAMRASMSVPGLLAPVEVDGRRLVDGGLVDNVPIGEVRERCGADIVIAVDVGSPLQDAKEVRSLLSVSTQMIGILTQQNVTRSLATLTPRDITIRPELGGITSTDFPRNAEAADRGRAAAEAVADRLAALGVSEYDFGVWKDRLRGVPSAPARVDRIEVAGMPGIDAAIVRRHLRQALGEPLDARRLEQDLLRIYGDAYYEAVDYEIVSRDGANVLEVRPREKSWGPDYLRFAIGLTSTWRRGSTYSLRGAYQRTLLNRLGGEVLVAAEIGTTLGAGIDFYQPLDAAQRLFFDARALREISSRSVYNEGWKIAEYRIGRSRLEAAGGLNVGIAGQVRLGWQHHRSRDQLDTGLPVLPAGAFRWSGPFVRLEFDQLNAPYFPSRGWAARVEVFDTRDFDFTRAAVEGRLVGSLGDQVFALRVAHTGSTRGRLPYFAAPALGGLFNLSAFTEGQLLGDDVSYAGLRIERIVGRMPIGLRGDLRVGLAAETGRVGVRYTELQRAGWNDSWVLYLGGLTPIGPVYLGYAKSTRGPSNAYLVIGSP